MTGVGGIRDSDGASSVKLSLKLSSASDDDSEGLNLAFWMID